MTAVSRIGGVRRWLTVAAVALVAVSMGWVLVDGWAAVRAHDWDLAPGVLLLAALAVGVSYLAGAVGYVAIVEALLGGRAPRRRLGWIWMVSLLGRYVPGSVVMVAGRVELSRDAGIARRVSAAALVYEQALSIAVASIVAIGFVTVVDDIGPGWLPWVLVPVPVLLLALLHPRVIGPLGNRLLRRLGRPPMEVVLPLGRVFRLAAWFVVIAASVAVGAWLVVRGMGGPEVGSAVYVGGAFLAAYAVASLAVVVPSGLGIRDGLFAVALAQHVPGGVAVALSVAARLAFTLAELGLVAALTPLARRR